MNSVQRRCQSGPLSLREGEGGVRELQKSPKVHHERSENLKLKKSVELGGMK